jgi:mannose/cellobiose epimerase-like protein (N-acyl-D-glucosamine 2-epimerase family)
MTSHFIVMLPFGSSESYASEIKIYIYVTPMEKQKTKLMIQVRELFCYSTAAAEIQQRMLTKKI